MSEYDNLVDIYDHWSAADPAATSTLYFYTSLCREEEGSIVELGVGNGRIALELAKQGIPVIGVDISQKMLLGCQAKAKIQGLEHLIQLIRANFQDFILPDPVQLIIMPFRTFGHLLTKKDKIAALTQIYKQLVPGGRLVFDHYIFDKAWARNHNGVPRLMCKIRNQNTGNYLFVWDTYLYDFGEQLMDCLVTVEEVQVDGTVISRQHCPLSFSYIEPNQVKTMLYEVGFEVEKLYGSFDKEPFDETSKEQIWVVKRPLA